MNANNLVTRLGRRLLGQEDGLDVGEHAAPRDGDVLQQSIELLIVLDGKCDVAWDDPGLLVVPSCVPS